MFFHWTGMVVLGLLVFVSLLLVVNLLRAASVSQENYKKYQSETASITADEELQRAVKHTELYHIY